MNWILKTVQSNEKCKMQNPIQIQIQKPYQDLFFFFQAEDGIRDLTVTGVQTCALPISFTPAAVSRPRSYVFRAALSRIEMQVSCHASPPAENRPIPAVYGDRRKKACEEIGRASCRERV